jgi:hypothetical protein
VPRLAVGCENVGVPLRRNGTLGPGRSAGMDQLVAVVRAARGRESLSLSEPARVLEAVKDRAPALIVLQQKDASCSGLCLRLPRFGRQYNTGELCVVKRTSQTDVR